ncbi:SirB2 family protein [Pseudoalteromonas xiamenensis]|uniref:SirB2 family protein n=1 Tax=Pseudoalteromonas xiamenensis TaxID=882626 RepID=A0A975DFX9_9GAMM|nr:SirB2 family protein [Pseudoalteromonas xiamenensis]QTH71113.1 SirB2 family protein [Pseudoalteromonas xiamenensis]
MSYIAIKHTHLLFVVLSILLFYTRSATRIFDSKLAKNKVLFISSHATDTFLLLSAIALIVSSGMSVTQPWLMEKIALVVAYIGLGVVAAKTSSQATRIGLVVVITGLFALIGKLAVSKTAFLL